MGTTLARCKRVWTAGLAAALSLLFLAPALAQTVYWQLEPVRDPAFEVGTYTSVGGATTPDGVNFKLTDSSADQPQILTLVSKSGGPLRLTAFKEGGAPFLDRTTDASGKLSIPFRTGEEIRFRVAGAAGATYQLSVWRGPAIVRPAPAPVVSMASVVPGGDAARGATARPGAQPAASTPAKAQGGPGLMLYLLLGGILAALIGIGVLIFLGQQRKAAT
jgi:hypothetical protein